MKKLKPNSLYADMDEDYEVQLESECYKAKLINRLSELEELRQATQHIVKESLKDKEYLEDVLSTSFVDCLGAMSNCVFLIGVGLVGIFGVILFFGSLDAALSGLAGGAIAGLVGGIVCIMFSACVFRSHLISVENEGIDREIIQRKLVKIKHYIDHKVVIIKALSNSIETIKRKIEDINYDLRKR